MPLIRSASNAARSRNIAEMHSAGHPLDQSIAAAYRMQRTMAKGPATGKMSKQSKNPETRSGRAYTHGGGSVGSGQTPRTSGGSPATTPRGTATRNVGGQAVRGGTSGAVTVHHVHEHHHHIHRGKK
jgi:hypothetical protein